MNQIFITFEDYLRGELNDNEKTKFEETLKSNVDIKTDFNLFKILRQHQIAKMNENPDQKLLEEALSDLGNKYFDSNSEIPILPKQPQNIIEKPQSRKKALRILSIAASVLVLFCSIFALRSYSNTNYSNKAIVSNFVTNYSTGINRSSNNKSSKALEGLQELHNKNYKQAIVLLSAVDQSDVDFDKAQYFISEAYFFEGMYEALLDWGVNLKKINNSEFRERAEWNLLLANLMLNRNFEAELIIDKIKKNEHHIFFNQSQKISNDLNSWLHKFSSK